jgi:hypothetical protein
LYPLLDASVPAFEYWDKANYVKEQYREITKYGVSGTENKVSIDTIRDFMKAALSRLNIGISKAHNQKDGVISTYFINEVLDYEEIVQTDSDGNSYVKRNKRGLACFRVKKFRHLPLPLFLEGPVHYLHCNPLPEEAAVLSANVRQSGLFDQKLQMYKVNESIDDQPMEIGRARTFSPGCFENESIWLHMEYKYMLELLRNELYPEFYQDFKNVFVPFLDPEVYGRSNLENSSFIVSSSNPDPSLHGNGFVARLSGATAEFINILHLMVVGKKPFSMSDTGELQLQFKPALPAWLFTKEPPTAELFIAGQWQQVEFAKNTFSFMFLGDILVTYHNKSRRDTFGTDAVSVASWTLVDLSGKAQTIQGGYLRGALAEQVRNREFRSIAIELC